MALQMAFTIGVTGIVVPEAYFRVDNILICARQRIARIDISVYKDSATRSANEGFRLPEVFIPDQAKTLRASNEEFDAYFSDAVFNAGRTNPRRQAYLCLAATKPFFADAVSV